MSRRFLAVTIGLVATVAFLIGLIVAGTRTPAPAQSEPELRAARRSTTNTRVDAAVASFADVAERLNPAVVNIDATVPGVPRPRRRTLQLPDSPEMFERQQGPSEREGPRRGAGTGFLIDAEGHILTNHHVIADADRIMVRLMDGRSLRAERVGSDPDTDIALIKV